MTHSLLTCSSEVLMVRSNRFMARSAPPGRQLKQTWPLFAHTAPLFENDREGGPLAMRAEARRIKQRVAFEREIKMATQREAKEAEEGLTIRKKM